MGEGRTRAAAVGPRISVVTRKMMGLHLAVFKARDDFLHPKSMMIDMQLCVALMAPLSIIGVKVVQMSFGNPILNDADQARSAGPCV